MRRCGVLLVWSLVLFGCSAAATDPRDPEAANNRIVVGTASGEVYLINPDGSERLDLAGGQKPNGLQPVWSPDGRKIAWSEVGPSSNSIVSTDADGTDAQRARTPFSGYFGYWDPTATRLGFLGNAPPGTGLVIDEGSGADLDVVVDSDTFYFFSWSPDGTRWIVHSGSGLHTMDLAGNRTKIDLPDALFRAPIWTQEGDVLVAIANQGRNVIARVDPDTLEFEELLEVGQITNFVLDPTGRLLVVETIEEATDGRDLGNNVTAIAQTDAPVTSVLLYDMSSGAVTQIHDQRIGAAWWSPDGNKLAMLVNEDVPQPQFAQWLVWSRTEIFRSDRFVPTRTFASAYAPFYDQFAQSVSPWSPDSSRFVFTGTDEDGTRGLFVQPATPDTAPEWVADDAAIAFWSPT